MSRGASLVITFFKKNFFLIKFSVNGAETFSDSWQFLIKIFETLLTFWGKVLAGEVFLFIFKVLGLWSNNFQHLLQLVKQVVQTAIYMSRRNFRRNILRSSFWRSWKNGREKFRLLVKILVRFVKTHSILPKEKMTEQKELLRIFSARLSELILSCQTNILRRENFWGRFFLIFVLFGLLAKVFLCLAEIFLQFVETAIYLTKRSMRRNSKEFFFRKIIRKNYWKWAKISRSFGQKLLLRIAKTLKKYPEAHSEEVIPQKKVQKKQLRKKFPTFRQKFGQVSQKKAFNTTRGTSSVKNFLRKLLSFILF